MFKAMGYMYPCFQAIAKSSETTEVTCSLVEKVICICIKQSFFGSCQQLLGKNVPEIHMTLPVMAFFAGEINGLRPLYHCISLLKLTLF